MHSIGMHDIGLHDRHSMGVHGKDVGVFLHKS
jgi:hypothetical protein